MPLGNLFSFRWQLRPTWRQASLFCLTVGFCALLWAIRLWLDRRDQLRLWTPVTAAIDSATVVTPQASRRPVYAVRYWLSYRIGEKQDHQVVTEPTYIGGYSGRWRAMEAARRGGSVGIHLNPTNPAEVVLDAGGGASFFLIPLVVAAVALFFLGFAALFFAFGRRFGMDGSAAGFVPAPARFGVWTAGGIGTGFLAAGVIAFSINVHRRTSWASVDAAVDSADVVVASSDRGYTYSPRLWLSYRYRDSVYRSPLTPGWSTSNRESQQRRAAELAGLGQIAIRVNPREPLDVVAARGDGNGAVVIALWAFFTGICFGLAWLFRRQARTEAARGRHLSQ